MNNEGLAVSATVRPTLPDISNVVEITPERFPAVGRLHYVGAGIIDD